MRNLQLAAEITAIAETIDNRTDKEVVAEFNSRVLQPLGLAQPAS